MTSTDIFLRLKKTKAYFVLIHKESKQSAVYNRNYELIFEGASNELIGYAFLNSVHVSNGFSLTEPEQRPSWLFSGMEGGCVGYHVYNSGAPPSELMEIPDR